MRSDRTASANGHPVSPSHSSGPRTNLERLQAECRHQTVVISPAGAASRLADGELVELMIALDTGAPGAAREFVVACLEQRVVASALDSAQLLVSELVTNSFRHGGAPMDEVIVSVELMADWFRIGVQDSGTDAVIAAQPADLVSGGGFGLNLVQMLSERWGLERVLAGGTRVWAQLA